MTVKDDIDKLLAQSGVASTGSIKGNVDAVGKLVGVPFTGTIKETVEAQKAVVAWAADVVPKLLAECDLKSTGSLGDDVAALREALGVKPLYSDQPSPFTYDLAKCCDTLGVESDLRSKAVTKDGTLKVSEKRHQAKQDAAPCVCHNGPTQCLSCHADEHPCVCKMLVTKDNQPIEYCKATLHECLCAERFYLSINGSSTLVRGAPELCRQHALPPNPKKKARKG